MNYLGIDLGDGESAIALLSDESVIEPVLQSIGRQTSILSIVANSTDGILIGEAALLAPDARNLRARFKSRYLSEESAAYDIRRFATGLYDALGFTQFASLKVALGVPAGWTEAECRHYKQLVCDAGFQNVYTVSESRAAFLYCKHSHHLKVDSSLLSKPALVIDIGSSTTDFAYIVDGQEKRIGTFGHINLGGGLLEEALLQIAIEQSARRADIESLFNEEPTWRHFAEIAARKLKEMYFSSADKPTLYETVMLYYRDPPIPLQLALDEATMQSALNRNMPALNNRTFIETLHITLADAASATRAHPPELLVLTGGASRMAFFQEACQAAFPNAIIALAAEPEYTTAKGLCYAARIDTRIELLQAQLQIYFQSDAVYKHVDLALNDLAQAIAAPIANYLVDEAILPAVLHWRAGAGGSISDLEKQLGKQTEALLQNESLSTIIMPEVKHWSSELIKQVQKDLDVIFKSCHMDMSLQSIQTLQADTSLSAVSLVLPGDGLSAVVIALSGYIVASVFGGTGTALLVTAGLSNPIALVIGAALGVLLGVMGTNYGKAVAKDAPLPPFLRKMIPVSLLKSSLRSAKQRMKIEAALYNALTDRDGLFCQTLIASIAQDLTRQLNHFQKEEELSLS